MKINRVEKKKEGEMLLGDIGLSYPFIFLPSGYAPVHHRIQNTIWIRVCPMSSFYQTFEGMRDRFHSCNLKMVVDIERGRLANINVKALIQRVEYNLEIGEAE